MTPAHWIPALKLEGHYPKLERRIRRTQSHMRANALRWKYYRHSSPNWATTYLANALFYRSQLWYWRGVLVAQRRHRQPRILEDR